jgi:hypothetical protein
MPYPSARWPQFQNQHYDVTRGRPIRGLFHFSDGYQYAWLLSRFLLIGRGLRRRSGGPGWGRRGRRLFGNWLSRWLGYWLGGRRRGCYDCGIVRS